MSERIREIANHCFDVMPSDGELQQFAQMIVRECADLADSHTLDSTVILFQNILELNYETLGRPASRMEVWIS